MRIWKQIVQRDILISIKSYENLCIREACSYLYLLFSMFEKSLVNVTWIASFFLSGIRKVNAILCWTEITLEGIVFKYTKGIGYKYDVPYTIE